MDDFFIDTEIGEIIARYAREVREEKMRSAWVDIPYDHAEFQDRMIILKAIG